MLISFMNWFKCTFTSKQCNKGKSVSKMEPGFFTMLGLDQLAHAIQIIYFYKVYLSVYYY